MSTDVSEIIKKQKELLKPFARRIRDNGQPDGGKKLKVLDDKEPCKPLWGTWYKDDIDVVRLKRPYMEDLLKDKENMEQQLRVLKDVIAVMAQELYGNIPKDVENIPHETGFIM
jgi:hypothetical protein